MDILYQYYNEIVLAFNDYYVDFRDQVIIIEVPDDRKAFESVCQKIHAQILRIAETLDPRDKDILIRIERSEKSEDLFFAKQLG